MEHLKKFSTQEEYQEWKDGDDYVFPNVCKVGDDVVYNNFPEPFWIEALEDIRIWHGEISGGGSGDSNDPHSSYWHRSKTAMRYSFDKQNWTSFTTESSNWAIVKTGQRLYFRSTYIPTSIYDDIGSFYITGKCNIGGSILSLIYGDDYLVLKNAMPKERIFQTLFVAGHLGVDYNKIINAKDLILPDYVGNNCYLLMFQNCKELITAPRLPAQDLTNNYNCYSSMFSGCESLVNAPTLPARHYKNSGSMYAALFYNCSNLSYIKMLCLDSFEGNTTNWTNGVSPTGTFIANSKRTDFTRGVNGIPEGWDLYLYDVDNDKYVVKFKVNGIPYEFYTDEPRDVTWREFISSEYNTNGFVVGDGEGAIDIRFGNDKVLYNGELISHLDNIILNASYTIGQPTETTEE